MRGRGPEVDVENPDGHHHAEGNQDHREQQVLKNVFLHYGRKNRGRGHEGHQDHHEQQVLINVFFLSNICVVVKRRGGGWIMKVIRIIVNNKYFRSKN